jgi:hypothetical protein
MKKALIVSFPRSGTHFLMNTLSLNFDYDDGHYNLEPMGFNFYVVNNVHWILGQIWKRDQKPNFVKSHHEIEFFEDMLPDIMEMYDVFYISRDIDAVMQSYCRHLNGLPWMEGPKVADGDTLKWQEPVGGMLRYQKYQYKTMAHKYAAHVVQWHETKHRNNIVYVRYEDLNERFDDTVEKIGGQLGYEPNRPIRRPDRETNTIRDGRVFHVCQ